MPAKPNFKLGAHEHIVTAWAQPAAGPGWANQPLYLLIRDSNGKLRTECLQPDEQTAEMRTLYGISAHVHSQLTRSAESIVKKVKLSG